MQRRLITVILFALVAAFASSTILYRIISAKSTQASDVSMTQVYVASRDLSAGATVGESDVKSMKWPGTISAQWVTRREDLIGRSLSAAVNSGEPFPGNRLTAKGEGAGFASGIPSGMRVVAVHVDEQSGLARLIVPGAHVDVLSTVSAGGPAAPAGTRTIVQNVKVLSTGQSGEHGAQEKPAAAQSVNLLVSPQQAEILSDAIAQNRIQLVLRNPLDDSVADLVAKEVKPAMHVNHAPHAAPAPEKKPATPEPPQPAAAPTVEIVHGTKRTVTVVAATATAPASQEVIQSSSQEVTQ